MIDVKIVKLNDKAIIPIYAKPGDAGLDLTAVDYEYDPFEDNHIYKFGLAMQIPEGYVGLIFPRSSNSKTDHYLTNHVGVIDSGYRGEIRVVFKNRTAVGISDRVEGNSSLNKPYEVGNRIAQMIIIPYPKVNFEEVNELESTLRGESGFGSSGA